MEDMGPADFDSLAEAALAYAVETEELIAERAQLSESQINGLLHVHAQSDLFMHNIRAHRVRRKMTQKHVAEAMRALGCSYFEQATVSDIENGKRAVSLREAVAFAKVVVVPIYWLLLPMYMWYEHDNLRLKADIAKQQITIAAAEIELARLEELDRQPQLHRKEPLR